MTKSISFVWKLIIGISLLLIAFIVSMVFGAADTSLKDLWIAMTSEHANQNSSILREIRLPREIAAMAVGAALAVSGAIMQGITKNPLADPGLLGLTAGANFALALSMALIPSLNYFSIMLICFVGAAIGTILVVGIGMLRKGGNSPLKLVLAGSAVTAFLTAITEGISLFFHINKNVSMWTSGGLIGTSWGQLKVILPAILIGIIISFLLSRQVTILSLSEDVAVGLGQKTALVKTLLFIVITILAGAAVALVGNMAFIGLMVPHMVRWAAGTDYRFLLPITAIAGGIFMLLADTVARTLNAPYETPVAAIISILGLPFFLLIIKKGGNKFA